MPDDLTQPAAAPPSPWTNKVLVACTALIAVAVLVTRDAWADVWRIVLRDEEASHVLLALPVVLWLVWARKEHLPWCKLRVSPAGPALMLVGWGLITVGFNQQVQAFFHGGSLLVVVGAAVTPVGLNVVRRFWPAFVVLLFLLPVPGMLRQQIAVPMQHWTAIVTQFWCELIGMETIRNGSAITYNGQQVAIAEACNGMRMVFALVLVSFAYAYATPLRGWVRVMIVLLSPISAIVCNVIRLVPTVYVYGHFSEDAAETFHDASGWVMLFGALLLLMGLVRLLEWAQLPVTLGNDDDDDDTPTIIRRSPAPAARA